jgi:hypothetical protein
MRASCVSILSVSCCVPKLGTRDKLSPVPFPSILGPPTRDVAVRDLDFQPMKTFSLNAIQADSFLGVTDRHFIWFPVLGAGRLWSRATSVCVLCAFSRW